MIRVPPQDCLRCTVLTACRREADLVVRVFEMLANILRDLVVRHLLVQSQLEFQLGLHVVCTRFESDSHSVHEEVVELDRVGVAMLLLQILLAARTDNVLVACPARDILSSSSLCFTGLGLET